MYLNSIFTTLKFCRHSILGTRLS